MEDVRLEPRIIGYGSAVVEPSPRNEEILKSLVQMWEAIEGPRVGDFVLFPEGSRKDNQFEREVERFSHDWGEGLQTSPGGSWNLSNDGSLSSILSGFISFSGGLNPQVPKDRLTLVEGDVRMGRFWFFDGNWPRAHSGVDVLMPCRVYRYDP